MQEYMNEKEIAFCYIDELRATIDRQKTEIERLEGELIVERTRRKNAVDAYHAAKTEVARCKDCVYFQPDFVLTNNGERRPYTEEEKNSKLGMVTVEVGINCGSRCERFDYWEDNRFPVWFQENDYCSYFKKKYTGEKK